MSISIPYEESHRINHYGIIEKKCNKCNQWFEMNNDNFYNHKTSSDGYFPGCIICERKQSKEYRAKHHEKQKENQRNWKKRNREREIIKDKQWRENNQEHKQEYQLDYQRKYPEKMKQYNKNRQHKDHDITNKEWKMCKLYFNYQCAYCGMTEEEAIKKYKNKFHKEHVDHNGANDLSNCVPACKGCNSSKWEYKFEDWYNKNNPRYFEERLNKINQWLTIDYKEYKE